MAKGGLNDDDQDESIVALARRSVSQQRNNETSESSPVVTEELRSQQVAETAPVTPPVEVTEPPVAAAVLVHAPEPPSVTVPNGVPVSLERRSLGGRPRKPEPRILLRATVTKPNHEWVEQMWRTQLRADGSRYANMGEFIDELVSLARSKSDAASR